MEKKKYMYEAILAIWSILKTYGFDPISSNDDAKWESLIQDVNELVEKFNNPNYPRINFYVREIANLTISYYEKNPYFMQKHNLMGKAS